MPLALRSFVRQLAFMSVVWSAAGCHKLADDDCQLSNTCPGTLLETFRREAPECAACLASTPECLGAVERCGASYACDRAAQCKLRPNRVDYQDCLSGLLDAGISSASDPLGAWEGNTSALDSCLATDCVQACERDRSDWSCIDERVQAPVQLVITLAISVKFFSEKGSEQTFAPAPDVEVRSCRPTCGSAGAVTKEDGTVELTLDRTQLKDLHFELLDRGSGSRFPATLYYPGGFGTSTHQPIAMYLIPTDLVAIANDILIGREEVLGEPHDGGVENAGQSLILPDACRDQDTPSATGVTLHAQRGGVPLPRCTGEGSPVPCVWYADTSGIPVRALSSTEGWGGGVVGLGSGVHRFNVCNGPMLVSWRDIEIRPGYMTIARTWPLTAKEKDEADREVNPCAAQHSSSSITLDASAN
jgi:hypothetical protein